MKIIKIKAIQNMVNYKRPMCYISGETYPLPPYSTVIGMIHNACGFTSYHPMKVSIQGTPKSVVSDLQTKYYGGTANFEKGRHTLYATHENSKIGYISGPGNVELITDIDLIIHVLPDNEEDISEIVNGLSNPPKYLALGRHEDILNITDIEVVDCEMREEGFTKHHMYFLPNEENEFQGTSYKLKKVYHIDKKTKIRTFQESYKVFYVAPNTALEKAYFDDENNAICLV